MALPGYDSIEQAIRESFGENVSLKESRTCYGGDINTAKILLLSDGRSVFMKSNSARNSSFFDAEEEGIKAIADTESIKTPNLICKGKDESRNLSFLMMDVIESGNATVSTWTDMGHAFADMHLADTSAFVNGGKYGFLHDNYIGASVQINTPKENWIAFFRECRLEPQIRMAEKKMDSLVLKASVRLIDKLDLYLAEPLKPSLLHGDMWGGNHLIDANGEAVLIDPAAYVGHAEADLAMTELFRPMPKVFYEAYYEKNPMADGYRDRRELYNLYHMLNHFNLFGYAYYDSVAGTILHYAGK